MQPDRDRRPRVHRFISAVSVRRWFLCFTASIAVASVVFLVFSLVPSLSGWSRHVAFLTGALLMTASHPWRKRRRSAVAIEAAVPACRNLVVTAEELERHPDRVSPAMTARVLAAADASLVGVRPGHVVPAYWIVAAVVVSLGAGALSVPPGQRAVQDTIAALSRALPDVGGASRVRVRVEPPSYTRRPAVSLDSPDRIEVLAGSLLTFAVNEGSRVRFGDTPVQGPHVATASGYFAVEPEASGAARAQLIPLHVVPDHAPAVRIDAPGKDLLLRSGERTIPVRIQATDDLALENLELRYTRVSGTGEQFEFTEGTLPVRLERSSAREWRGAGALALGALKLGPGDSLVYRAVARDARPGAAGVAASETYFVEVAGPGQVALEGVEMPPELERYAMSQQMIVLKIERLNVRAAALPREELVEEAAGIAAEQRTVRANFVFLLGGHVEDEEVEAEQSHEIQEGRLENTARKDINAAIGHMTRAGEGLTAVQLDAALPPARAAVEALQRAFGKSRYLLRSLAVRSRLDPSRRLTGDLADARSWRRSVPDAEAREGEAARQLLERVLSAAAAMRAGAPSHTAGLGSLAESALRIDSRSPIWQEVAARLMEAKDVAALASIAGVVAQEGRHGALGRTPLASPLSPLSRAFRLEEAR